VFVAAAGRPHTAGGLDVRTAHVSLRRNKPLARRVVKLVNDFLGHHRGHAVTRGSFCGVIADIAQPSSVSTTWFWFV
jgi:hypothetical protein